MKRFKIGARYQDPSTGTWTQPDPAEYSLIDPQSVERYVFVGDDPISLVDATGLQPTCGEVGLGFDIAGAITEQPEIELTGLGFDVLSAFGVC